MSNLSMDLEFFMSCSAHKDSIFLAGGSIYGQERVVSPGFPVDLPLNLLVLSRV